VLRNQPAKLHLLQRVILGAALLVAAAAPVSAFTLNDAEGKKWQLSELKGKWVVVNFWATWCAPCVKEIPDLAAFAKAHPDKAAVLGVALDYDNVPQLKAFAKKVGLTYPLVLGEDQDQAEKQLGKVKGLPTTLVYDPSGKQVLNKTGTITREQLEEIVKKGSAAAPVKAGVEPKVAPASTAKPSSTPG
jgi:thiol-disulfide isomerase/thioredoxin